MMRKNEGFTLVELIVTILVSTLVAGAAATAILLGLRINRQSTQVQTQQNTTRILLSILEDMASEGNIGHVVNNHGSWEVREAPPNPDDPDSRGALLMHYENGAIYTGEGTENPIMEGVFASEVSYEESPKNLLTIQIETDAGIFSSTVHCKMGNVKHTGDAVNTDTLTSEAEKELADMEATKEARMKLLNVLSAERGSTGIFTSLELEKAAYFSEWYITTKEGEDSWEENGWNKNTPWCACFVSWGLAEVNRTLPDVLELPVEEGRVNKDGKPFWYANVDEFMAYFKNMEIPEGGKILPWNEMYLNESAPMPNPGDVIFFDRQVYDGELNPDHMGVVFHVDKSDPADPVIFTIEGNSMGRVAIRQYSASNKTIVGYGVLPWIPVTTAE